MKEVKKIKKIQITYDKKQADNIVEALQNNINIIKSYNKDLYPPEVLIELIEDLTWNELD